MSACHDNQNLINLAAAHEFKVLSIAATLALSPGDIHYLLRVANVLCMFVLTLNANEYI